MKPIKENAKKWRIFIKREKKIHQRLFIDEIVYGNRVFVKNEKPSLWEKIKCLIIGGSPYIKRIDPTKLCIWYNTMPVGKKHGKSIVDYGTD